MSGRCCKYRVLKVFDRVIKDIHKLSKLKKKPYTVFLRDTVFKNNTNTDESLITDTNDITLYEITSHARYPLISPLTIAIHLKIQKAKNKPENILSLRRRGLCKNFF